MKISGTKVIAKLPIGYNYEMINVNDKQLMIVGTKETKDETVLFVYDGKTFKQVIS